nr:hypothetical protein [Candidatus Electrothrix aestuarii]
MNGALGHEGRATKLLFRAVNSLVQEEEGQTFFQAQMQDLSLPGLDPYNPYWTLPPFFILQLNVLVRIRGLNPYLGILHSRQDSYESLVAGTPGVVPLPHGQDGLAVAHLRIIQARDFEEDTRGGVRSNRQASGRFLDYFERRALLRLTGEPGTLKQLLVFRLGHCCLGPGTSACSGIMPVPMKRNEMIGISGRHRVLPSIFTGI